MEKMETETTKTITENMIERPFQNDIVKKDKQRSALSYWNCN